MEDNDNERSGAHPLWSGPDPHGQAALLLVESILHGLVARSLISTAEAIEIVDIAAEVKREVATDLGDTQAAMRKSLDLLAAISGSLRRDLDGE